MHSRKQNLEKNRRITLAIDMGIVTILCLYAGLHLGAVYKQMEEPMLFGALAEFANHMVEQPFQLFPTDTLMVGIFFFIGVMIDLYLYNEYLRISQSVNDAHGDAAFEENMKQYNKEFLYNPKIVAKVEGKKVTDRYAPYNEEHKRVLKHTPGKKAITECQKQALILADDLFLALDGKWTQRNWNIMVFGASGAGKTRYFILPNILQLDGCLIVVDPSGDIEQNVGGILEQNGYMIKRLSTDDMEKSNRFNPLFYIRNTSDILVVVNTLLENTQEGSGKASGDADFWRKASQALLCAIIGYLVEVLPVEQRNFSNVLEILRNYKYTAEANKKYLRANPYLLEYCDEEIESVRVKPVGEEGYIEPEVVNSARKRALEIEKQKKAQAQMEEAKELDKMTLQKSDETKSKEQYERELIERNNVPKLETSDVLQNFKVSQMQILDSFSPTYEFD